MKHNKLINYGPDYTGQRGERFDPAKLVCSPQSDGKYYEAKAVEGLWFTACVIVASLTVIAVALAVTLVYVVGASA